MKSPNNFQAENGKYYSRVLFWEEWIKLTQDQRVRDPIFTLYKEKPGLINFGKAYVESEDPTGYTIANELLDGYRMWKLLMQSAWFREAKVLWDEELDARLTSKGLDKMKELLRDGGPAQQAVAAKYFADKEYRKDKTHSRGRPSKDQVEAAAAREACLNRDLADDAQRIKLVK